jgi:hypothetical protein
MAEDLPVSPSAVSVADPFLARARAVVAEWRHRATGILPTFAGRRAELEKAIALALQSAADEATRAERARVQAEVDRRGVEVGIRLVTAAGGEIRVPDSLMVCLKGDETLTQVYDPETRETIVRVQAALRGPGEAG